MSSIARSTDAAVRGVGFVVTLSRARSLALLGGAGLLAGAAAFALLATSDHLVDPTAYGLLVANVVVGSVAVALAWLVRRPGNRVALLLLVVAAAAAGVSLQGASDPVLHSVGVLFDPVIFVVAYWAVFAFPHGRLADPLDKLLVAAPAAVVLVSFLPWFLFSPVVAGGAPLARCTAACPENALMIADRPDLAAGMGQAVEVAATGVALFVLVAIVYRLVAATPPRRRALLPVYVPAALLTIPFGLYHAAGAGLFTLDADATRQLGWFVTFGRGVLPYGFLLALLLAALFADDALKTIVRSVRRTAHPAHLQSAVAEALHDPGLRLAFRDAGGEDFVGIEGDPIVVAALPPGLAAHPVGRNGRPLAYIVHDAALDADPELVEAAGDAMLLALEGGRLERELRTTISALRASRDRLAATRDTERRRIERDLHDGAQQHLFALRMEVAHTARMLAREHPDAALRLQEVGEGLGDVVDDLRNLAHAIAPAALADLGLEQALAAAARRATPPATFSAGGVGRFPAGVESAVYFCCLEALQNVARHAGEQARTRVRVWEEGGALWFEVADDGAGFSVDDSFRGPGKGLASMTDRIEALGGTLTIASRPGGGATVRGIVPRARALVVPGS